MKKGLATTLSIILTLYLIICVVCSGIWIYLKYFAPRSFKETTLYANSVEDISGKKSVMEVVSYKNLFELKFNYYSDYNSTDVISSGVQIIDFDKLKMINIKSGFWNETLYQSYFTGSNINGIIQGSANSANNNICFYEISDGLSYAGINNKLDDFGCIKIEIDGVSYALQLGKVMNVTSGFLGTSVTAKSSLSLVLKKMHEVFTSGIYPSGTHSLSFKFEEYFDIFKFDGKEYKLISDTDKVTTYIYTTFTNYNEEAKTAKDSMFGQVQYNSNWTNGPQESLLNEYFSDTTRYILTEQNCKFTFDETINKHIGNINEKTFNEFKSIKQNYVIVLDLDYLNEIGVVFGGFNKDGNLKELGITEYYTLSNGVLTEVKI